MSFIPQDSISENLFEEEINKDSFSDLDVGTITSINIFRDTVEVETDSGLFLRDVQLLMSKVFDTTPPRTEAKNLGSMASDIPIIGTRVVVGYLNGRSTNPIIIGCLPNKYQHTENVQATLLGIEKTDEEAIHREVNSKRYLHQSHYWDKVDGRGNYEQYLPDGTEISVSDEVTENNDKLSYTDLYALDNPLEKKTVRIKHSSGTVVTIKSSGEVVIDTTNADSDQIQLHSGAVYVGDVTADNELIAKINNLDNKIFNHIHPTGVGPSGQSNHTPTTFGT